MAGLNVIAAETDEHAEYLSSSLLQQFLGMVRGKRGKMQPPRNIEELWTEQEKIGVNKSLRARVVGSPETVKAKLEEFVSTTQVNELMINSPIFNHQERLKSYEIVARFLKNNRKYKKTQLSGKESWFVKDKKVYNFSTK